MAGRQIEFVWPRKRCIIFIGITGESLLRTYIAEDDIGTYIGPPKKVNIWILILTILSGRWGARGYYRAFLRVTKPKFVLTFEDNALEFYLTKMFYPSCVTACIQNGRRDTYSSTPETSIWKLIRQAVTPEFVPDVVLSHGEPWSSYYISALGSAARVKAIGSVRNNAINLVTRHEPPRVLFVSSFPNLGPAGNLADSADKILGYWQAQTLTFGNFYRSEGLVAASAAETASTLGLEFCVLGKRPEWQQGERKYYENVLGGQPWDYLPAESKSST